MLFYLFLLMIVKYIFIKNPYNKPPSIFTTKLMSICCSDNTLPCITEYPMPTIRNIRNPKIRPVLIHLFPKKSSFITNWLLYEKSRLLILLLFRSFLRQWQFLKVREVLSNYIWHKHHQSLPEVQHQFLQ